MHVSVSARQPASVCMHGLFYLDMQGREARPLQGSSGGDSSVCGVGIGALSNLRELRVSGNKLSSLSAEVGSLRKLHRLIADGNLLTSIPGDRLLPASNPRNRQQHSSISA